MRCENCPALKTKGYEYPESYCSVYPEDEICDFDDGCGCKHPWNAIKKAFAKSNDYEVKRLTSKTFRIVSKDDNVVSEPFVPEVVVSDNAVLTFDGEFKNEKNNEAFVIETLEPNHAIGIWLQRDISNYEAPTNEQIVRDYDEGKVSDKLEEVALIINYDIDETNSNNDGDNDNEDNP